MVEVRDFTGVIAQISGLTTKSVTSKKDGKKYVLYNIGVKLDEGSWHNISGFKQEKVEEVLKSTDLNRAYEPGDQVKIYEESKDNQFWQIKAIVSIAEKEPESAPDEIIKVEEIDMSDIEVDHSEPKVVAEKPESKTAVSDYKTAEANKFSLGMAINCSAVLLAAEIRNNKDIKVNDLFPEAYPTLVKKLYQENIELRKELLGY